MHREKVYSCNLDLSSRGRWILFWDQEEDWSLCIKFINKLLSSFLSVNVTKFEPNYIKSSCYLLLLFCLDIASLLYNSFPFARSYCQVSQTSILKVTISIIAYWFHAIVISKRQLLQQLVSEQKVDERRYVEDRKFYDKSSRSRSSMTKENFNLWQKMKTLLV